MLKKLTLSLVMLFSLPLLAVEEIEFEYSYDKNHGVDFSSIRGGPFKVSQFTDGRDVDNPSLITDLGADGGYQTSMSLADVVRDAVIKGFLKGDANLADEGENLLLTGEVISSEAELVNGDSVRLTIRASVQLQRSGRTLWQTNLFGRGTATADEGFAEALSQALTRLVDQLMLDDYFLLEIL